MPIIHHKLSSVDALTMKGLLAMFADMPKIGFTPDNRPMFDAIMAQTPTPAGVSFEPAQVGGVSGWWARPAVTNPHGVILYLHGGGYIMGSAAAYRNFVGHIAQRAGYSAFIADYALAPERPFPAALTDLRAVHQGLAALGYERIALCGDSAGGGLALSFQAAGVTSEKVVGIAVMSPWIDLSLSGSSMSTRDTLDPLLSQTTLQAAVADYLGETPQEIAEASAPYTAIASLPPVRVHVGDAEVLLDDSLRFAQATDAAGLAHEVHVWDGMVHVFPSNLANLQAALDAVDDVSEFLGNRLRGPISSIPKKVLVLGATGGTGRQIIKRLNKSGHVAVALVRSLERAQDIDAVLIEGDALNPAALDKALSGCDAVISALGTSASPFKEVTLLSRATQALVESMKRNRVEKLVSITGMGAGDSRGHGGFAFDNLIMPLLLRKVYADKDRQEKIIEESGLHWVIVRPAVLNNKPGTGTVRTLTDLRQFQGGTISRTDVAEFVVEQIGESTYIGKKPLIVW